MTVRGLEVFLLVSEKTIYRVPKKEIFQVFTSCRVLGVFQKEDIGQLIDGRNLIAQTEDKKKSIEQRR